MYDGIFETIFDCVGEERCAYARFYVEPHDANDECTCRRGGGSCVNLNARRAALEALRTAIAAELQQMREEAL